MKPIKGRLHLMVIEAGGMIELTLTWTDEEGRPMMRHPVLTIPLGGVAEVGPIYGVLGVSTTTDMKIDYLVDYDEVGAEATTEGRQ